MIKHFCDRCEVEVKPIKASGFNDIRLKRDFEASHSAYVLCTSCAIGLVKYLKK